MKKRTVTTIRWVWIAFGATSAVVGFFAPFWANEAGFACWIAVFFAFAPYSEK